MDEKPNKYMYNFLKSMSQYSISLGLAAILA